MDRLRQLLTGITAQLSVLTISQRVAIGLCAAMIAGSLLWLLQWSTRPELVPLVNYEFTYSELDNAEEALKSKGLTYDIRGTRVYVRPADRHNALRLLHTNQALPEGSLFDMNAVVTDPNPFISPDARRTAETYAKGNELAKIIATYPFVRKASVMLNEKTRRRIGAPADVPTASVAVALTTSTELTMEMVDGFAKLVAGAVAGLEPHNVYVTDSRTGRSYSVPHPDDALGLDYLDIVKRREEYLRQKIVDRLSYIPGVRAQVSVELDISKSIKQTHVYDDPQPKTENSETSETTSGSSPTEPGVQANLGQAVTASEHGQTNTLEKSEVENYEPRLTETETVEQLPFATKRVTATVSIPRSFVVGVYTAKYPDSSEPKDDTPEFVAVRSEQIERVTKSVERIVMVKDPHDVEVDVYPDMEWSSEGSMWSRTPGQVAAAETADEGMGVAGILRSYGPQLGLSALALLSFLMMTRVVQRSSDAAGRRGRTDQDARSGLDSEPILASGVGAVGQAEPSESVLTAKEVDEATMRFEELGAEVSRMVEDDPEAAANLIRRWIEAD
ncbi:MAG: flagellar M-ring protein FliF C-terminal domain-containing protein [Phycisphaerae bacterium]